MRSPLWETIRNWLTAFSTVRTLALIVGALGGSIALTKVSNIFAHVTGVWLVVERLGWFELFLCALLRKIKRDDSVRVLEITGAILYALVDLDTSEGQSILVKIRLEPSRAKNIKAFALALRHGDQLCDGERLPIANPTFITKLPDGLHHWRKHVELEKVEGDIENKLANDDSLILSSPCSAWLRFAFRGATINHGDTVAMVATVTDETGYGFTIRDDLVHVH